MPSSPALPQRRRSPALPAAAETEAGAGAPLRRVTDAAYARGRKRRIWSSLNSMPSVTRVGSKTRMSSPCSRSVSGPVSSRPAHLDALAVVRPGDGRVIHVIAVVRHDHHQPERGRRPRDDLLLQVVAPARAGLLLRQRPLALLRLEAVAHPALGAVRRGPPERVDRVVGHGRVALRRVGVSAAWIAGPASGCRPIHSPSFSKSGWPVSGSGFRSRVNSRKSSGVRTKKHGSERATMSVFEPSGR